MRPEKNGKHGKNGRPLDFKDGPFLWLLQQFPPFVMNMANFKEIEIGAIFIVFQAGVLSVLSVPGATRGWRSPAGERRH